MVYSLQCSLPLSPLSVAVNCMSFNHNSNLLLTGAVDGMIRLFGRSFLASRVYYINSSSV